MSTHTPGPWSVSTYAGQVNPSVYAHNSCSVAIVGGKRHPYAEKLANATLIAAAPDLLALAHQYAEECGDCAGTRVCPDDERCTACADVWAVIDKAEGRA